MSGSDMVAVLVTTIVYGSIYGLVAIGMTLIYGTLRILDMSQGSMVMIGSYVAVGVLGGHGGTRSPRWCWPSSSRSSSAPSPSWSRCSR